VRRSTRIAPFALDLHVLGTPPAFVLSQDQTLQLYVELNRRQPGLRLRKTWLAVQRRPGERSRAGSWGTLKKLTAELPQSSTSWACYLVFKDRAACTAFRLCASVADSRRGPTPSWGCIFYLKHRLLSTSVRRLRPLCVPDSVEPFLLLGRGAASTPSPHPASTGFGDLFNHPSPSTHFRIIFFRRGAASTSLPRPVSTSFGSTSFRRPGFDIRPASHEADSPFNHAAARRIPTDHLGSRVPGNAVQSPEVSGLSTNFPINASDFWGHSRPPGAHRLRGSWCVGKLCSPGPPFPASF
jgi:hypothetical protein